MMNIVIPAFTLAATCLLCACSGGSADGPAPTSPPPVTQAPPPAAAAVPSTMPVRTVRWTPRSTDTWQWQLHGPINTAYPVDVYDIDLMEAPQATIDALKIQGKRIVCYFSAGSSEDFRPDFSRFLPQDMGNALNGWPGERWLDTRSANVRSIMQARLDLAAAKGCDGVEPDNVDGFSNDPGLPLTAATQLDYLQFLAAQAHQRGLAIGLKNDVSQIALVSHLFDFAVNEQCIEFDECAGYAAFVSQGKPVFNAEYAQRYRNNAGGARDALCTQAHAASIHTLVLPLALDDASRFSCD